MTPPHPEDLKHASTGVHCLISSPELSKNVRSSTLPCYPVADRRSALPKMFIFSFRILNLLLAVGRVGSKSSSPCEKEVAAGKANQGNHQQTNNKQAERQEQANQHSMRVIRLRVKCSESQSCSEFNTLTQAERQEQAKQTSSACDKNYES